ncbi:MAG: hypothetical protein ABSC46_08910 [Candidatus Limnocylindrales bacterium]|jgi:hypothetical protein
MTQAIDRRSSRDTAGEDLLNEEFHALLREAANKREGRARVQSTEDAVAAAEESRALFALARGQTKPRPGPAPNG